MLTLLKFNFSFVFLNWLNSSYTSGKNEPQLLEVEGTTARLILRKAVATVCAHTGYTDTSESVLRFLTDVLHEFLTKLTNLLRANTDSLLLTDRCPFHVSFFFTQRGIDLREHV